MEFTANAFQNGSDISMAAVQDSIADSLVAPEGITHLQGINPETGELALIPGEVEHIPGTEDWKTDEPGSLDIQFENAEGTSEQAEGNFEYEVVDERKPSAEEAVQELADEQRNEMAQQLANEQVQQAVPEIIERFQLNDEETQSNLTAELAGILASPEVAKSVQAEMNGGILGDAFSQAVLASASQYMNCGGDASKIPPISPQEAQAFTADVLSGLGNDPRLVQVDPQKFTNTFRAGFIGIIDAFNRNGWDADVRQINSREAAIEFAQHLQSAFTGQDPKTVQVDAREAIRLADFAANYIRGLNGKLATAASPRGKQAQSPARGARRASQPRFQTNNDIFGDPEVLETIANERL